MEPPVVMTSSTMRMAEGVAGSFSILFWGAVFFGFFADDGGDGRGGPMAVGVGG